MITASQERIFLGGNQVTAIFSENISITEHGAVVSGIENESHQTDLFAEHLREINLELRRFDAPTGQSHKYIFTA